MFSFTFFFEKVQRRNEVSTLVATVDGAEQVLRCCWDFCQRLYIKEKIKRGQVKLQLPFYSVSSHKKDTEFRERQSVNDVVCIILIGEERGSFSVVKLGFMPESCFKFFCLF